MILVMGFWIFVRALLFGSAAIALENLALRHQLLVLQRSVGRPRLARWDRVFWVWLSRVWVSWRSSLVIVQPATVLTWHRQGFRLYWQWKSRPNPVGRPKLDAEIRRLIRRMARENPTWGRRRIQAELALLGYAVAELTVGKYMHRTSPRPSPTWRAFLTAHARDIVAIDFFVVPTLTFRLLFVFVVLRHDRRELLHLSVTDHPTADWTARQILQTFPEETAPRYMLRDRDTIYGESFTRCIASLGIREVRMAPRAP
jgi:putative transposase